MCQDTDVLNFTKITGSLGRALHIFEDMPITCKGDLAGVIFNSIQSGYFYFDLWTNISPRVFKLVHTKQIYSNGVGRIQVDFPVNEYFPTDENYFWGIHYASSNSDQIIRVSFEGKYTVYISLQ